MDRNEGFADDEFKPPERRAIRGVVYREDLRADQEEHRAWLLGGLKIWLKWMVYGAPALIAAYTAWVALLKVIR